VTDTIPEVFTTLTTKVADVRRTHGAKLIRFGAVSAFNVVFGQIVLYSAQVAMGLPPVPANIFAVTLGTIPAYVLSRYWVWNKRDKNRFMREVVPFWTLALIGFALSTVAVWFVDIRWDPSPLFINLTNLVSFGVIWMAKFVVLDRVLFNSEEAAAVS
jgi:putative flippase GtrA